MSSVSITFVTGQIRRPLKGVFERGSMEEKI